MTHPRNSSKCAARRTFRSCLIEHLESRQMLAVDGWHNVLQPLSVQGDSAQQISPLDVLSIVNEINTPVYSNPANGILPDSVPSNTRPPYFDVDCDGYVGPLDALNVVNYLNGGPLPTGWRFNSTDASQPGSGSVSAASCSPQLTEGTSLKTELTSRVTLPNDNSAVRVTFAAPSFDTTSQNTIRDAFEIVAKSITGETIVLPYSPRLDSVVNWTEQVDHAFGPSVVAGTNNSLQTATINLTGIPAGTKIDIVTRLINNDRDQSTSVVIRGLEVIPAIGPNPTSSQWPAALSRPAASTPNIATLQDLTPSFVPNYGRTTATEDRQAILSELRITNSSSFATQGQLLAVIDNVSDLDVQVISPDGFLADGRPFLRMNAVGVEQGLAPGSSTEAREIRFTNPIGKRFDYTVRVYGTLHRGPTNFTSTPVTEIEAGRTYAYQAIAVSPVQPQLQYSIVSGPANMTIEPASGQLRWLTDVADIGNHRVVLRATDSYGFSIDQTFAINVLQTLPNRPPTITSTPTTDATVARPFEVVTYKTGAGPTAVAGADFGNGSIGLITANADEQQLGLLASGQKYLADSKPINIGELNPDTFSTPFNTGYSIPLELASSTSNNTDRNVQSVLSADVNGDGYPDLIVLADINETGNFTDVREVGSVLVRLGNGDGSFKEGWRATFSPITGRSGRGTSVRYEDVTSDGRKDLVVTTLVTNRTLVYAGAATGLFNDMPIVSANLATHVTNMQMADLNGDGNPDIALFENFNGQLGGRQGISIQFGDGAGNFSGTDFYNAENNNSGLGYLVDVDGINGDDLVRMNYSNSRFEVMLNDGAGRFGTTINSASKSYYSLALQGFDANPWSAYFADWNNDGKLDLVAGAIRGAVLFLGQGNGRFGDGTVAGSIPISNPRFRGDSPYGVGLYQTDGVAPDLNGDGRPDFLFGDLLSGSNIMIGLNKGQNAFEINQYDTFFPSDVGTGSVAGSRSNPYAAIADFNRDGVIDVVAGASSGTFPGSLGMFLGNKPGTLRAPQFVTDYTNDGSITRLQDATVTGDFTGDGILDVVVTAYNGISVAAGKGDGTFGPLQLGLGTGSVYQPIALDIDLDGKLDLAWSDGGLERQAFGLGNGAFQLLPAVATPGAGPPGVSRQFSGVDDFNGDGYPDLVYRLQTGNIDTNFSTRIVVHIYDPIARRYNTLPDATDLYTTTPRIGGYYIDEGLGIGDLNGDGRKEFFAFSRNNPNNGTPSRWAVYESLGVNGTDASQMFRRTVIENPIFIPPDVSIHEYVVSDFNGDGKADIAYSTHSAITVVMFGNGDFTFRDPTTYRTNGLHLYGADFNGDAHLDLLTAWGGGFYSYSQRPLISAMLGKPDGTFSEPQGWYMNSGYSGSTFGIGDFNRDGRDDFATISGLLVAEAFVSQSSGLADLATGDLDGDGRIDTVSVSTDFSRVKILLKRGLDAWERQSDLIADQQPVRVALTDVGNNQSLDIVTANDASRSISVFKNDGKAKFARTDIATNIRASEMAIEDLNGDGFSDVVVASRDDSAISILLGNATLFNAYTIVPLGFKPTGLAIGDVTGDGKPDAILSDSVGGRVVILPGRGDGSFGTAIVVLSGGAPHAAAAVDMNADGKLDLVLALPEEDKVGILFNRGGGKYSTPQKVTVGKNPIRLSVQDFNKDGKPDILVPNRDDDTLSVIINRFNPNSVYRYTPTATDPDGDPVTFELASAPGGMLYDESTGTILWAPMPEQIGNNSVVLSASDGRGGVSEQAFTINVSSPTATERPVFTSLPRTSLSADQVFEYQPRVETLQDTARPVRYSIVSGPSGMTIDPTSGQILWDPRTSGIQLDYNTAAPKATPSYRGNAEVRVEDSPSLRTSSVTVEGWFQFDNPRVAVFSQLMSKMYGANSHASYGIEYFYGTIRASVGDATGRLATVSSPLETAFGVWTHLAMSFDDSTRQLTLYINGKAVESTTSPIGIGYSSQPFLVGQNSQLYGATTRTRVWNYARSVSDIQQSMLANVPSDAPGLVLDFNYNTPSSPATLLDLSPFSNHGSLVNMPDFIGVPKRIDGLADIGDYPVTIRVDDGDGGIAEQSFIIRARTSEPQTVQGMVFEDANGNGIRDLRADSNLVVNSDFNSNEIGFSSDFGLRADRVASGWLGEAQGTVGVFATPLPQVGAYPSHTNGSDGGKMLVINGDQTTRVAWRQSVAVEQGQTYDFSFWALRPMGANVEAARFVILINGTKLADQLSLSDVALGKWKRFAATWTADSSLASLEIVSLGTVVMPAPAYGTTENNSALDDIVLTRSGARRLLVTGTDNPYLAGMPAGSTAFGSVAPANSPPSLVVSAGQVLRINAIGRITFDGGNNGQSPDGVANSSPTQSALNGISQLYTPNGGALLGVFLDDNAPASQTPPETLDFRANGNVLGGIDFTQLAPSLRQLFVIGNGKTSSGVEQTIIVPAGATRLFLAGGSTSNWTSNNQEAIEVQVFDAVVSEAGQAGRVIYSDVNANDQFDVDEPSTTTDASGLYGLRLAGAEARLRLVTKAGQLQTTPVSPFRLVDLALASMNDDFGSRTVSDLTLPHFISAPLTTATAPGKYQYQAFSQDPGGTAITYSLSVGPDGMAIDARSGLVQWSPTAADSSNADVVIKATDADGQIALQSYRIAVTINTPPIITSAPRTTAMVGIPYIYQVYAQDAEQASLNYVLGVAPQGMTVDASTGLIRWTPSAITDLPMKILVNDGSGGQTMQEIILSVTAPTTNHEPTLIANPRFEAVVNRPYGSRLHATDIDGDALTYGLVNGPSGLLISSSGEVTWHPSTLGEFAFTASVVDGRGGRNELGYTVSVTSRASAPHLQIASTPIAATWVGSLFRYDLVVIDAALFEIVSGPVGMSIDPLRGTVRWIPTRDQIGLQTVVLRAVDALGNTDEQTFQVAVRTSPLLPSIASVPPTRTSVGATYLYSLAVANPSNSPLTYALTHFPAGMTISAASGVVNWTPSSDQVGPASVIVRVSDGAGNYASQAFKIVVFSGTANLPPSIESRSPEDAIVGQLITYQIVAVDPEGSALTYAIGRGPADTFIDARNGRFTWTPTAQDVGSVSIVLTVTDPLGGVAVQSLTIDVRAANRAPTIGSKPPTSVSAGALFQYDVVANDLDREPLTYALLASPSGTTIDSLGRIRWQTDLTTLLGPRAFRVQVSDGFGGKVEQSFDLGVVRDTTAPRLTILVTGETILFPWSDRPAIVRVIAADDVGVTDVTLMVDGKPVELAADGTARIYFSAPGNGRLIATATDASGNKGIGTSRVSMRSGEEDGSGNPAPQATITSVSDGDGISGFVNVIGTAEALDFASYTLSYRRIDEVNYKTILNSTTAITNGSLGKWDTTLLENDNYVLKLEVLDSFGSFAAVDVEVSVTGNFKLGNFRLSFEDMTIPVAGIPITITRTYDTLRADRDGDFGYGWRLEYRNTDLRTSLPKSGLEDIGIYTPFKQGTKVFLTLPGGTRQGFTFTPDIKVLPGFGNGNNLVLASPKFTPDRGVTSTLSAGGGQLFVNDFGELYAAGGTPWNPASPDFGGYRLTTRDGFEYRLDGDTGLLTSVQDTSGNVVRFDDDSIDDGTSNASVKIARDMRGRINSIHDTLGNSVRYAYSTSGDLTQVIDRMGNKTKLDYDPVKLHYLSRIVDPLGRQGIRNEYDTQGRLAKVINAMGAATTLSVDPSQGIEESTDALGNKTIVVYDDRGNTVRKIDAEGGINSFSYDDNNNLTRLVNELGQVTVREYDARGNLYKETTSSGRVNLFQYDDKNRLQSLSNQEGDSVRYTYDSQGRITRYMDAEEFSTYYAYDARGNLVLQTNSDGSHESFEFDATGNVVKHVDARGAFRQMNYSNTGLLLSESLSTSSGLQTNSFEYDANGQLIRSTNPLGNTRQTEYDASRQVTARTDENGNRTIYEYDFAGNPTTTIYPDATPDNLADNPRSREDRNAVGQVIRSIDETGVITEFQRDRVGRTTHVSIKNPDNSLFAERSVLLNPDGSVQSETNPLGQTTRFLYDTAGNRIESIDPLGNSSKWEYDLNGRLVRYVDPEGRAELRTYDRRGLVLSIQNGRDVLRYEYDSRGNQSAATDPLGNRTTLNYDVNRNLKAVNDPLGGVTRYEHNESNQVVRMIDANADSTHYSYDAAGGLESVQLPMGQIRRTRYDANGNAVEQIDYANQSTKITFDARNRATSIKLPDGTTTQREYNGRGEVVKEIDARGTTQRQYAADGQLVRVVHPDTLTESYQYDDSGNKTAMTSIAGTTNYKYDSAGRLTQVLDGNKIVTTYTYDRSGKLVQQVNANGVVERSDYDDQARVIRRQVRLGSTDLADSRFSYDANGNRIRIEEMGDRVSVYTYDALSRLVGESQSKGSNVQFKADYHFDAVSNRIGIERTTNNATSTSFSESIQLKYDANNRLISQVSSSGNESRTYDENGNLASKQSGGTTQHYRWNSIGQLIAVDADGNSSFEIQYRYDANGNRIEEISPTGTSKYVLDLSLIHPGIVAITNGSNEIQSEYILGLERVTQTQGGAVLYFHQDANQNTSLLSNAAGQIVSSFEYDSQGRVIEQSGTESTLFLFAGEQRDSNTGLDYLRSRYLDISVGAFISPDGTASIASLPITGNTYLYAMANSQSFQDPSGQTSLTELATTSAISGVVFGSLTFLFTGDAKRSIEAGLESAAFTFAIGGVLLSLPTVFAGLSNIKLFTTAAETTAQSTRIVKYGREVFEGLAQIGGGNIKKIVEAEKIIGNQVFREELALLRQHFAYAKELVANVPQPVWDAVKEFARLARNPGGNLALDYRYAEDFIKFLKILRP